MFASGKRRNRGVPAARGPRKVATRKDGNRQRHAGSVSTRTGGGRRSGVTFRSHAQRRRPGAPDIPMSCPAIRSATILISAALFTACSRPDRFSMLSVKDVHSLSNPQQVRVATLDLDLQVHFDSKMLTGTAILGFTPLEENA